MKFSLKNLKVALITGGWSGERNENIAIAKNIKKTLEANGVNPLFIILNEERNILSQVQGLNVDFVFLSVTEEVPIQPILDMLNIPYNGSSNMTTSLSLDKDLCKILISTRGVKVPKGFTYNIKNKFKLPSEYNYPLVVKPMTSGSSCGVSLVKDKKYLKSALRLASKEDENILIEEYLEGTEITIPVVSDYIMPAVAIKSPTGIWDEEHKNNLDVDFNEISIADKEINKKISNLVKNAKEVFRLESFWRIDTIYKDDEFYFLEINTQPCMAAGEKGILASSFRQIKWDHFKFLSEVASRSLKKN